MEGGGKVVEEELKEVEEVEAVEGGGAPDGGYGWLVVLGCVLQLLLAAPLLAMFGLLFGPKFAACGMAATDQATVFSLFLVTWSVATVLVGPLVKVVGERAVAAIGTTTLVLGLVVTAFSSTSLQLGLSISLLLGAAFGLSNVNCLLIVNSWFKRNVGLALSVMNSCVSLGKMGVPQVVAALMARFTTEQVTPLSPTLVARCSSPTPPSAAPGTPAPCSSGPSGRRAPRPSQTPWASARSFSRRR